MQAIPYAQAGLTQAIRRLDASAERVASSGEVGSGADLAAETVEQIQASNSFSANLAVLQTANEMENRLLDIKV